MCCICGVIAQRARTALTAAAVAWPACVTASRRSFGRMSSSRTLTAGSVASAMALTTTPAAPRGAALARRCVHLRWIGDGPSADANLSVDARQVGCDQTPVTRPRPAVHTPARLAFTANPETHHAPSAPARRRTPCPRTMPLLTACPHGHSILHRPPTPLLLSRKPIAAPVVCSRHGRAGHGQRRHTRSSDVARPHSLYDVWPMNGQHGVRSCLPVWGREAGLQHAGPRLLCFAQAPPWGPRLRRQAVWGKEEIAR